MNEKITEENLPELKQEIEQSKSRMSQKEGRLQGLIEDLKKKWKCETFQQGKEKKQAFKSEKEQVQEKIDSGIKQLQEKYGL